MRISPRSLAHVFRLAFKGWRDDNCMSMGAALAFYSLLSMAPLLVLVITLAGLFIGTDKAHELLLTQLSGLLGDTGAQIGRASCRQSGQGPAGACSGGETW